MRIYLDMCCLKREFDDQTQLRVQFETEAIIAVLGWVAEGRASTFRSPAHDLENARNPDPERAAAVGGWLERLNPPLEVPESVVHRTRVLQQAGLKPLDSYHLAWAEEWGAEILLTTDDRLLSFGKARRGELRLQITDPVTFVREHF